MCPSERMDAVVVSPVKLTPRERDLVRELLEGRSNKEISERLGISVQTVKNTLPRLYRKCGVSTRLELAAYARKHHLA